MVRMVGWRRALWIGVGIATCALVAAVILSITAESGSGSDELALPRTLPRVVVHCPGPEYLYAENSLGISAIVPRNDCTPSFTRQDVVAYLRKYPFPNKDIQANGPLSVVGMAFLPVKDVPDLSASGFPLPGSAIVCYVELYGSVTFSALGAPPSTRITTVYVVFDARTGNILGSGGG